jgi:hypothetical protein
LLASFERKPDAKTAANLGRVELIAGKPRDAAEHLSFFLREAQSVSNQDRQATEEMLAQAKAKIGTVAIQVDAQGAAVLLDGQRVGTSPLVGPVFVEPGSRRIEVRKEGFDPASTVFNVAAGSAPTVELTLSRVIAPVQKPVPPMEDPPATGGQNWRTWAIAGSVGLATVGVGVGTGFSVAAGRKNAAALDERDRLVFQTTMGNSICPNKANDARCGALTKFAKDRDTYRDVAIAGFMVGGVAAAGALVSALWKPSRPGRSADKERALLIVPSPQGIVVTGAF